MRDIQAAEFGQIIYRTGSLGVAVHDSTGRIVSANPAAAFLLDTPHEILTNQTWQSLADQCLREDGSGMPPQELPWLVALQSGNPWQGETVLKIRCAGSNQHRWLRVTGLSPSQEGKEPAHAYTLLQDVTELRESTEHEEEVCSQLLSFLNDGFWDWSQADNKITVSARLYSTLGYSEAEIAQQPDIFQRMIHPDDRQRVGELIRKGLEGKYDQIETEYRLRHKLGHSIHVISRICFLRDQDGFVKRICGTSIDITERIEIEQDRLKYQSQLKEANESLERRVLERTEKLEAAIKELEAFSYSVSHDLRAPLRHINSFSAILLQDFGAEMSGEASLYLERIAAASSRMGALIDDLLELSKVSRTHLNRHPVDLSELASEVLTMHQETEQGRLVEISIGETAPVMGDKTLLYQLLGNLLGNAWKYTSFKSPAQIQFGTVDFAETKAFFVRDNGIGFDMAYKERLFNPFERLHGEQFPGLGIGLATAERIVKRHGGRIWAEGKVGEGSTFYFTLPIAGNEK